MPRAQSFHVTVEIPIDTTPLGTLALRDNRGFVVFGSSLAAIRQYLQSDSVATAPTAATAPAAPPMVHPKKLTWKQKEALRKAHAAAAAARAKAKAKSKPAPKVMTAGA